MKKKGILAAGIITVLLVCLFALGCKNNVESNADFTGTWEDASFKIVASADGTFEFFFEDTKMYDGTYSVKGNTVTLTNKAATETGTISGNIFTLGSQQFTRK